MIKFVPAQPVKIDAAKIQHLVSEIRADAMGGWLDLPANYTPEHEHNSPEKLAELAKIKATAQKIQSNSEFLVCIGIGGSYLGHRAIIEALRPQSPTKILYAGNSLSPYELEHLFSILGNVDFSINVISKSGTTTEPAVAFRFFKEKLFQKYGSAANERIFATTDAKKGALHDEAQNSQYATFVVPDNIGGRYSVLSAVGLLPLAVAGVDIDGLLAGAFTEAQDCLKNPATSPAAEYATTRAELLSKGFDVEILASFEPSLQYFAEWWKQLFGESEGKQQQGIFPASVIYTTDLHSLGQYLQDGRRNILETMLRFTHQTGPDFAIPALPENLDGLKYLEGQSLSHLNDVAMQATIAAHHSGNIPVLEVIAPDLSARSLGALIFFFEFSCALSAKLSSVNPFDQPGVETYKTNMFRLLGKPGA